MNQNIFLRAENENFQFFFVNEWILFDLIFFKNISLLSSIWVVWTIVFFLFNFLRKLIQNLYYLY